ncbi:MAG: response regulator transcription factor [Terriglobales bacterium]
MISLVSDNLTKRVLASSHVRWGAINRTAPTAPRVVLADDQPEMLQIMAFTVSDEFEVVGLAENGSRAIELATKLSPDVLVLDIAMPVVNGIEAACRLKELGSRTRVIFLTVHSDPEFVEAALSVEALGYVLKASLSTDLIPAIWAVTQGNIFISPLIQLH